MVKNIWIFTWTLAESSWLGFLSGLFKQGFRLVNDPYETISSVDDSLESLPWIGNSLNKYPLANIQKAIENGHLWWVFPWKMVIFHSYVSLPEGICSLGFYQTFGAFQQVTWQYMVGSRGYHPFIHGRLYESCRRWTYLGVHPRHRKWTLNCTYFDLSQI